MQDLHLVGFTKDHRHLIFSTRKDAKSGGYVVPVDDDLVEAVDEVVSHRAENPDETNDQVDEAPPSPPRVESQLSVREVQARLRAGDPADQIARDAGVDAVWVERFAQPIRAEQRRVVERALTMPFTRPRAGASAVPLRRAIAAAMAERDVDFTAEGFEAAWSARLVGGAEWVVAFEFPNRGRRRVLEWDFDIASGKLTTTDRFASQLAFVESAGDLPPVEATVGAEASRVGSQMSRGPLTSGGLARPGSGRVTEPSPSASSLPPLVRPPVAPERRQADLDEPIRRPDPPRDRLPGSPLMSGPAAEMPKTRMPSPQPAHQESAPETRSVFSDPPVQPSRPPVGQPPPEPTPPRPPAAPRADVGRPTPAPPPVERPRQPPVLSEDRPRQPMATTGVDRPQTAPVPPRRPAPVAAPTNATRTHTRRPVPEIAPRMPVTVDPDAVDPDAVDHGAGTAAPRRGSLIEDEHALDKAVPSHPPGRGESVVILRAVDDPSEPDGDRSEEDRTEDDLDFEDSAPDDVTPDDVLDEDVDEEDVDLVEADSDERDDEYDDDYDEYDEDDHYAYADDDADLDEPDPVGHVDSDEGEIDVEEEDDADDADDEASAGTEFVEVAPIEPAAGGDVDVEDEIDVEEEDEADDADADTRPRPVRATVRRSDDAGPARRRRLVARRDTEDEAPDDEQATDDDTDETGRESSVQFRPGSATQAGSGRSAVSSNGRDEVPEAGDDATRDGSAPDDTADDDTADDETTGPSDPPPRPRRRRRRTEPLRAR